MIEIKEVLRLWLRNDMGLRKIAEMAGVDRKTVRRYVEAGEAAGLVRSGGEGQLTDELLGVVVEAVRPSRPAGRGASWQACETERQRIQSWLDDDDLELTKVNDLLERRGVRVPYSTLHRFATEELGYRRPLSTVPVADGKPGEELQIDFGRMGLMWDPQAGRRRAVWALIFTAVVSRHMFVWLSFRQTIEDVIGGCEAAWDFFDGYAGLGTGSREGFRTRRERDHRLYDLVLDGNGAEAVNLSRHRSDVDEARSRVQQLLQGRIHEPLERGQLQILLTEHEVRHDATIGQRRQLLP
jgi:transposase